MNVLVVDDHQIILDGLEPLFNSLPNFSVKGYVNSATEALRYVNNTTIDIIVTDIDMPDKNGIWLIKQVKAINPSIKILVLTMHNEKSFIEELLKLNVDGYLLKTTTQQELKLALENVAEGKKQFSYEVTEKLLAKDSTENKHSFSQRELEVLDLVAEGLSTHEIAERLFLSSRTVEKHRANLLLKADVKNVAGLIRYGFKNGLLK